MREILFKGRSINGEWHIGLLAKKKNDTYISNSIGMPFAYQVDPETVCQYTGLTDKNGVKIWECDIVKYIPTKTILQVLYINGAFAVTYMPNAYSPINWEIEYEGEYYDFGISNDYLTRSEVLGNIFDNPELLSQ
jgi:uncharacterized phage protein (TIGR01671 family)